MLVLSIVAQLTWAAPHAPPPPSVGALSGEQALALLGETPKSDALAAAMESLALERLRGDMGVQFGREGLCLLFDSHGNRIEALNTVSWSRADQAPYQCAPAGDFAGELPFGLRFDQPREDVEAALGQGLAGFDESDCWYAGSYRWVCARYAEGRLAGVTVATSPHLSSPEAYAAVDAGKGLLFDGAPPRPAAVAAAPAPVPAPASPAIAPVPSAAQPGPLYPSLDEPVRTGRKAEGEAAVVIGLESYPFLGSGVPYAKRDAQAFADFLVYTRGVPMGNVQTMTGGSREQILAAIDRASAQGGTVWVYFAGHGAASPETGDRMLLGDDVRPDPVAFASRGVGVGEIERRIAASGGSARLVLDTCYTGAGRDGGSIAAGTRFVVPAYAAAPVAAGTQWNAASPDQVSAPIHEAQHGAFTYFALGALRGWADGEVDGRRDGKVTAVEASLFVNRALRRNGLNAQTPVWMGPEDLTLSEGVSEAYTFR